MHKYDEKRCAKEWSKCDIHVHWHDAQERCTFCHIDALKELQEQVQWAVNNIPMPDEAFEYLVGALEDVYT